MTIDKEPTYSETGEARMRTPDEIQEAEREMYERRWYDHHILLIQKAMPRDDGPEGTKILTKAGEAADRIEATYGKESLQPMTDFEWGVLSGRHYALRWVLGDEWENGDT